MLTVVCLFVRKYVMWFGLDEIEKNKKKLQEPILLTQTYLNFTNNGEKNWKKPKMSCGINWNVNQFANKHWHHV